MSERLSMRKVREVLRLKHQGRSRAEIAVSIGIGESTVSGYVSRAEKAGLTWPEASAMTEADVEARLFRDVGRNEPPARVPIDFAWVHRELSRVGVTLQTLWVEYREGAASAAPLKPYEYSRFCELYGHWKRKLAVTMRQVHRAGEKLFIDYSGKKLHIVDPSTGEATEVELFVAVLGASNYTYAEATRSQKLGDFVASTVRTFEFFGRVPQIVVPDQLRSAVSSPDRYEPDINPTYLEMAQHYGVTVIPARPRKPRDKAKVEGGVLIAQRWIIAALRNRTFFSLAELNDAIRVLLERLNTRPFQKLEGCRRSAFETIDKPAMRPLPARRYELADWKHAKVNIDYCITYDHRHYSVPQARAVLVSDRRRPFRTVAAWVAGHTSAPVQTRWSASPSRSVQPRASWRCNPPRVRQVAARACRGVGSERRRSRRRARAAADEPAYAPGDRVPRMPRRHPPR
jgi:transposase